MKAIEAGCRTFQYINPRGIPQNGGRHDAENLRYSQIYLPLPATTRFYRILPLNDVSVVRFGDIGSAEINHFRSRPGGAGIQQLASLPKDRRSPACALPVARTPVPGLSSRSGRGAIFLLSQQQQQKTSPCAATCGSSPQTNIAPRLFLVRASGVAAELGAVSMARGSCPL